MKHMETKKAKLKWIIIVELIVFYFSLLNVISHARGPVPYQIDTSQPVVRIEDFVPMAEMGVDATETALPFYNAVEGSAVGYQTEVSLQSVNPINIQFQIECPPEQSGTTLYVDLYNFEASYDNPEQEKQIVLQEGLNQIQFDLNKGEQAPGTAYLRLFTLNVVDYQIEQLQIYEKMALPKVSTPMWVAVVVMGIVLLGTIGYKMVKLKEEV